MAEFAWHFRCSSANSESEREHERLRLLVRVAYGNLRGKGALTFRPPATRSALLCRTDSQANLLARAIAPSELAAAKLAASMNERSTCAAVAVAIVVAAKAKGRAEENLVPCSDERGPLCVLTWHWRWLGTMRIRLHQISTATTH